VTVKDVVESGVEIRPNTIVMINPGWTDKMWGKPGFWEQMPYLERGVAEYVANKGAVASNNLKLLVWRARTTAHRLRSARLPMGTHGL
jgi:hypothetical protein